MEATKEEGAAKAGIDEDYVEDVTVAQGDLRSMAYFSLR